MGSEVTILQRGGHVLPREDADAAEIVHKALARDGHELRLQAKILGAKKKGNDKVVIVEGDGSNGR